jgi:hypothetical protein
MKTVLLSTISASAIDQEGQKMLCGLLLDSGVTKNCISHRPVNRLSPKHKKAWCPRIINKSSSFLILQQSRRKIASQLATRIKQKPVITIIFSKRTFCYYQYTLGSTQGSTAGRPRFSLPSRGVSIDQRKALLHNNQIYMFRSLSTIVLLHEIKLC